MVGYCFEQLHMLFQQQTTPDETAAIVMEPVLGEGGYVAPPAEFLREVKKMANERGVLFVADEVCVRVRPVFVCAVCEMVRSTLFFFSLQFCVSEAKAASLRPRQSSSGRSREWRMRGERYSSPMRCVCAGCVRLVF